MTVGALINLLVIDLRGIGPSSLPLSWYPEVDPAAARTSPGAAAEAEELVAQVAADAAQRSRLGFSK